MATRSYRKEMESRKVRSYRKKNIPLSPGVVSATQSLLSGQAMKEAEKAWRVGKKTKLGKVLGNKGRKKKGNPEGDVSSEVEEISEKWHGRKVQGVTEVDEVEEYEEDLAELGDLEELGILDKNGEKFAIVFKKDRPKLCCDGQGHNLEVIGGDQELDLSGAEIEHEGKRLTPIGYSYYIVYETDKHHLEGSNGYPESYEHYWGEDFYKESLSPDGFEDTADWFQELEKMGKVEVAKEEGLLPIVVYNQTDGKIMLTGGKYEVTELGIRN